MAPEGKTLSVTGVVIELHKTRNLLNLYLNFLNFDVNFAA